MAGFIHRCSAFETATCFWTLEPSRGFRGIQIHKEKLQCTYFRNLVFREFPDRVSSILHEPRWLAHPTPISHKVRSDWTPNCWRRLGTCPDEFSFLGQSESQNRCRKKSALPPEMRIINTSSPPSKATISRAAFRGDSLSLVMIHFKKLRKWYCILIRVLRTTIKLIDWLVGGVRFINLVL